MTKYNAIKVSTSVITAIGVIAALGASYWINGSAEAQENFGSSDGSYTMSVPENWERLDTEAPFATFQLPEVDLTMHVLSLDSGDVVTAELSALDLLGIDVSELEKLNAGSFAGWDMIFYQKTDASGVTTLCQMDASVGHCLVFAGDAGLTSELQDRLWP